MSASASHRRRKPQRPDGAPWRTTLYDIIFEADTPAGRWFDIGLLVAIVTSITFVSLETLPDFRNNASLKTFFSASEWLLTFLFTIEYVLRLICARRPLRYAFSFWGIVDLLSILPTYVTFFAGGSAQSYVILRSIRLLRVFRVLKLWRMMKEADELADAIWHARNKIVVFLAVVLVAVTISGTMMYHIETVLTATDQNLDGINPDSQFTSIPQSMYWAIVTMTTVGYGDVVPTSPAGKIISAGLILLGYSLIIVPSVFVSAEITAKREAAIESSESCAYCGANRQRTDAIYCYRCGSRLDE